MRIFTYSTSIARPREAVFDFFLDFNQAARWRKFVRSMQPLTPGPIHAGSRIHTTCDLSDGEYVLDLEVLACDRPNLWRHTVDEVDFRTFVEYRFEPEAAGTRVTMRCDVKPVGLYGWLGLPLLKLHRDEIYRDQLPQLKRTLEE
jgi:hypothetical protein